MLTVLAEPKVALALLPMTTFATFDRSGTAPPAQLAGSNQSVVEPPPVQVTEFSRVILLAVLVASVTV